MSARKLGLAGFVVALALFALPVARLAAEECQTPPTAGTRFTWPEDARVTVFVDPSIPGWSNPEFRKIFNNTFSKWEFVGGSGVSFTIVEDAQRAVNPPRGHIGVSRGSQNLSHLVPGAFNLDSARITLDDHSANPDGMKNPLAHEIGHTFGLDHCPSCPAGTSVMAAGGAPAPSYCDRQAVKANGNYTGIDLPGLGGGRERPENCADCGVRYCTVTLLCRCPNGDCNVREGRLVGDWQCTDMGTTCQGGRGCCSATGGGPVGASSSVCGQWEQATDCEWGAACCYDLSDFPPITPPPCAAYGWYGPDQRAACEADGTRQCEPVAVYLESDDQQEHTPGLCWAPSDHATPLISCGSLGGDYCSQEGVCPDGYSFLGVSSDCDPCCISPVPTSCQSAGCAVGSCGWQTDNCGGQIFCGECEPSCGEIGGDYCSATGSCPVGYESLGPSFDCRSCCAQLPSCGVLGGDYCSQSGYCPGGYDSLGASHDCSPCCRKAACQSSGCPAGSCGWQTDNCGEQIWCGDCGLSCGAMGGDYCSQSGQCPGGYDSLGASYDCNPCCRTAACQSSGCPAGSCGWRTDNCGTDIWCGDCGMSCGEMGGDYCSQSGRCPGGYDSLGASYDCNPCCRTAACQSSGCPAGSCGWQTDNCGTDIWCDDCGMSCGEMGGDFCSQVNICPKGSVSLGRTWDCIRCCVTE